MRRLSNSCVTNLYLSSSLVASASALSRRILADLSVDTSGDEDPSLRRLHKDRALLLEMLPEINFLCKATPIPMSWDDKFISGLQKMLCKTGKIMLWLTLAVHLWLDTHHTLGNGCHEHMMIYMKQLWKMEGSIKKIFNFHHSELTTGHNQIIWHLWSCSSHQVHQVGGQRRHCRTLDKGLASQLDNLSTGSSNIPSTLVFTSIISRSCSRKWGSFVGAWGSVSVEEGSLRRPGTGSISNLDNSWLMYISSIANETA